MRILILGNNDKGIYNLRKELVKKLVDLKHDVYISIPNGDRVQDLKNMGCRFIETNVDRRGKNILKDFKLLLTYRNIIKRVKPEVVLTYTIKPNTYGGIVCRINKIPYMCNITGLGTSLENKSTIQKVAIMLYKVALKDVKYCFVQNTANLEFLKKHNITNESKYKLIPGSGVNLEQFKLLPYPKEEKIKFIFVSRIMKEKGIEQYLDTAKYITKKYKNTEFHILGFCEKEYEGKLEEYQNENIVNFHGMQKDVIPFLKESSCLIHPSYYPEGMSNVLLEASASGRPIITTNRPGCREIVEDGKTGFMIEIKNTKQLIEKVEKFVNMPREQRMKMGLEARKKVEREFDRNIIVNAYLEKISELERENNGL